MFVKFPLEISENEKGKKKITFDKVSQNWTKLKKSQKIIKSYGVRTGYVNKNSSYILLDFDNKEFENGCYNGIELMNILIDRKIISLNNDYIQKTGNNGYHFIFKISKEKVDKLKSSKTDLYFENTLYFADIKANNQFFIGAGSEYVDKNGNIKKYTLINDKIREIPDELYKIFFDNMYKPISNLKKVSNNIVDKCNKLRKTYNNLSLYMVDKLLNIVDIKRAGNYDSWFSVLVAVYGANSEAKDIFIKWSKSHPSYKNESEESINKIWDSYNEKTHNIGILKNMARKDNKKEYNKLVDFDKTLMETVSKKKDLYYINSRYICDTNYTFGNNIEADLYNNKDDDKMKVRKLFKKFTSNDKQVIGIKSPMDTGKTHTIREMIKNNQSTFKHILMISTRRSFCQSVGGTYADLGFKQYLNKQENVNCVNAERAICSLESLEKFMANDPNMHYDLIILDEIESILKQFNSPYINYRDETFGFFMKVLGKSHRILACDADFDNSANNFLKTIKKDYDLLINTHKTQQKRKLIINKNDYNIIKNIDLCMKENKKVVVVSMSNRKARKLELTYKSLYPEKKVLCHTGESTKEEKEALCNVNKNWVKYDILIYTSTVGAGIDFNIPHFDSMFAYISGKSNSPRLLLQLFGRIRKLENPNIHSIAENVNLNIQQCDRYTYKEVEEVYKNWHGENSNSVFIYNKQEELNKGYNSFLPELEQCLKTSNYEIEIVDEELNKELDLGINSIEMDFHEYLKIGSLVDVETIDQEEYEKLKNIADKSIDDTLKEKKYIFMQRFGIHYYDEEIEDTFNKNKISKHYILDNIKYMTDIRNMKIDEKKKIKKLTISQVEVKDRCNMINSIIVGLGFNNCWDFESKFTKEEYDDNMTKFLNSDYWSDVNKLHFNVMFNRSKGKMLLKSDSVYKTKEGKWEPILFQKKNQWFNQLFEDYGLKIKQCRNGKNRDIIIYKLSSHNSIHEFIINKKKEENSIIDRKKLIPKEQISEVWVKYYQ